MATKAATATKIRFQNMNRENPLTHLVQREARVARNGEIEVQGGVEDLLGGISDAVLGADLGKTLADVEDAVDKQAVGRALDLEVAEEGVGAEQRQYLVEDVVRLGVRVGRLVRRQRRVTFW